MELFLVIWGILLVVQPVISDCTVQSKTEEGYLKYLDKLKGQIIHVQDEDNKYQYNITFCESIQGQQNDVGVYQTDLAKPDSPPVIVGRMTATHIKAGTDWILLTYQNGSQYHTHCDKEARQAHIMMICDTKNLIGKHTIIEENNKKLSDCAYIFEFSTSAACTQSAVSPINGLSIGSIIVIITLSLIVAYIIFGFIFNRFFIGAKGIEQFPNVSFWRDFGNLVADGCVLVFRTKPPQEPRSYKGLGDDQLGFDEDEERDDHMLPM